MAGIFGGRRQTEATGLGQGQPRSTQSMTTELNIWFLDDGTLGDTVPNVIHNLDRLLARFPEIGAVLNGSKCEVIPLCHSEEDLQHTTQLFRSRLPSIKFIAPENQHLLGSALTDEAVPGLLNEKLSELTRLASRLQSIDAHPAFTLLKNCFAIPKLLYILRTSNAYKSLDQLREIDNVIKSCLTSITNVSFNEDAWSQARLPVRYGGLGIRTAEDLAPSAHLASHYATEGLVTSILQSINPDQQLEPLDVMRCWQERAPGAPVPNDKSKQKKWDEPVCKNIMQDLIARANQVDRARLLAAREEGSGAWVQVLPIPAVGTLLDETALRIAVAHRVGAPVCEPGTLKCRCSDVYVDHLGLHPLSCRYSAGRAPRHAHLNDIIKRALTTAGLPSVLEPEGLARRDNRRPDGMTVFPFRNGKALVWDATCVDTYASTHVNHCALQAGHAANNAERNKNIKYQNLCDRYIFQPIAVEIENAGVLGK